MSRTTRRTIPIIALAGLIASLAPALVQAADESELLATIQDENAPVFDRMFACKQLGTVGTEAAVPVLAALLDDDQFAHYARYGLEPIPSPKVDQALLSALSTLKGKHLIGVIYSLANRGKPEVIQALAAKLDDSDDAVATAAAHSIARLGTPEAAAALNKAMSPKLAAAGLLCGKTLAEQGHKEAAASIFVEVSEMEGAARYVRQAAMLQAVDLLQAQGVDMLAAALASENKSEFNTALRAARLLTAADAARAAEGAIPEAAPRQAALLITLLGDLAQPSSLPVVAGAADSDDAAVRVAALDALATLGKAEHVPLLMKAAGDDSPEIAAAAQATLAALDTDGVDEAVLAALDGSDDQPQAIRLVGQRKITAAVPKLLELLDGAYQIDVVTALGELVSLDKVDVLARLLASDSAEVREAARKAVHSVCYRQPDRAATAEVLAEYLEGASEETVAFVMDELRIIGGDTALRLVVNAAKGDDALAKDYATRALGEWLDISVGPAIWDLFQSEGNSKYGIREVKGYIRLARQFAMDEEQRVAICRVVIASQARDDEKKLVFEVLKRYPSIEMLKLAAEAGKNTNLKADAQLAGMTVAQAIDVESSEFEALLSQLELTPVKLQIVSAKYGAGDRQKDVSRLLRRQVKGYPLIVLTSEKYNEAFGGDPAPGDHKQLVIEYKMDGKSGEATLPENAAVLLPTP